MSPWLIYTGTREPHDGIGGLPDPPNWRRFSGGPVLPVPDDDGRDHDRRLGRPGRAPDPDGHAVRMVNAALYLRRPLLVTGYPGTGKSSLAHAVARELNLGPVLRWPITSRSRLQDGLYQYDPIARLSDENLRQLGTRRGEEADAGRDRRAQDARPAARDGGDIGRYLRLGPLGTALLPYRTPRVVLVDEIDKSDIDLPNDLLNVFEDGEFEIEELSRLPERPVVTIRTADRGVSAPVADGVVRCRAFPLVILTSNGEREFPPAFLRRCLRLDLGTPSDAQVAAIVEAHLGGDAATRATSLVREFLARRRHGAVATDQLLNAVYLTFSSGQPVEEDVLDALLRSLAADGR